MRYLSVYRCPAAEDLFPTVFTLIKRGTFASEKQYNYLKGFRAKDEIASKHINAITPPEGAELCIDFEEHFSGGEGNSTWGRKSRRRERIIWCNAKGVLRIDAFKFQYDDARGSSSVKEVVIGKPFEVAA